MSDVLASTRVDKWLWAARCFKTRSMATAACDAGVVKINGDTAKPAKAVKPGDLVDARTAGGPRVLRVVAIADKRGSATVAATLFEDLTPPQEAPPPPPEVRDRGAGRPTKRDRRRIDRDREQW